MLCSLREQGEHSPQILAFYTHLWGCSWINWGEGRCIRELGLLWVSALWSIYVCLCVSSCNCGRSPLPVRESWTSQVRGVGEWHRPFIPTRVRWSRTRGSWREWAAGDEGGRALWVLASSSLWVMLPGGLRQWWRPLQCLLSCQYSRGSKDACA